MKNQMLGEYNGWDKAPVYFRLLMCVANWKKMTPLACEPGLCEHHMREAHSPFSPVRVHFVYLDRVTGFTRWLLHLYPAPFHVGAHLQWPTGHHRGSPPNRALPDDHALERIPGIQEGRKESLEDV